MPRGTRAPRAPGSAHTAVGMWLLLLVVVACGAEGIEAPRVLGAHEDTGCPSADSTLARTREAIGIAGTDGILGELRPTLERVLVEEGGLRVLLRAMATVVVEDDSQALSRLLPLVQAQDGLGSLTPHVVALLRHIDGSSAWSSKPHLEPLAAVHAVLTQCDAASTIGTVRGLLSLEVTEGPAGVALASPGAGQSAWLTVVLERARAALDEPELRTLLDMIEIEDPDAPEGSGGIRVGRDAFLFVARLLAGNIAAPNFDPAYSRDLLDQVLVARVQDPAARARLLELIDLVLLVTDPQAAVFPAVQSLMACVNDADADAALPGLLFDWLTIEQLSVGAFLDDVRRATSGGNGPALRGATIDLLGAVVSRPALASDAARVAAAFIDAPTAPILVRTALRAQGRGVLHELTTLLDAVNACRTLAP